MARLRAHETKVRFLAAGMLNTAFGLGIFPLLILALRPWRLHYLVVLALCQVIGVIFSYTTNRLFVFRSGGPIGPEFARFCVPYVGYFLVNLMVLPLLVEVARIPPIIAQTGYTLIVVVTSYVWHSRITFRPPTDR